MRICHVAPELLPVPPTRGGAIERWVRDATTRLAARGHDVHVVSRDHGDGGPAERTIDGVQYHFVRIPPFIDSGVQAVLARGPWYHARAARLVGRLEPHVVHHHSRPVGLLMAARRLPSARHVISLHSMDYGWAFAYAAWDRRLFPRAFETAARLLAVSQFIARHTAERYPAAASRLQILYNGVDTTTFCPEAEQGKRDAPVVLYVGRVEERKGVHVLLEAFERVIAPALPNARLQLVGPHSYWGAEESPFYRRLAARCRDNPRIELRGATYDDAELSAIYRGGTVAAVPSVFPEALGLTSLEAQASGVPVVVSDAGGLPETVAVTESGLVCRAGDAASLGARLLELLTDDARRTRMGLAARAHIVNRFSWDVIAGQLEELYLALVAERAPRSAA